MYVRGYLQGSGNGRVVTIAIVLVFNYYVYGAGYGDVPVTVVG